MCRQGSFWVRKTGNGRADGGYEMIENILAIVVINVLVLGGMIGSIVKYIAGKKQICCRESETVELINKSYRKAEKKPETYVRRHVGTVMRKGEHAHGNV